MNEYNDQITTLRLELAREKDKSEAFRHALNVEVLKVMRVAVIQATIDADNEIARLKEENERMSRVATEGFFISPQDIKTLTEEGKQGPPFMYDTNYTVSVERHVYLKLVKMMEAYWGRESAHE